MSELKKNRQLFYSQLEKIFAGKELEGFKGKSGFSNLLNIKAKYFKTIQVELEDEISKRFSTFDLESELFQKLNTFFDSYLNETGSPYFNKTEFYKNLYEKVYSNSEDTALFWKTQKLFYVKSDSIPKDAIFEIKDSDDKIQVKVIFDTSKLQYSSTNNKKELSFLLSEFSKSERSIKFLVHYKSQKLTLPDEYSFVVDGVLDNGIPVLQATKANEKKLNHLIERYEFNIKDNQIAEAIYTYKKQQEVDFFIHKDAESFLKEQFNLYLYQYLFKDGEIDSNVWNSERIKSIQNIKEVAFIVIDKISRFEDELKAMWLKPKFVRNLNYIITVNKLANQLKQELLEEDLTEQIEEWIELQLIDKDFTISEVNNEKYKFLPIDTKYLSKVFIDKLLSSFDNLDEETDGVLIKSDNFQALNSLMPKYRDSIDLVYIDPPFNTGSDFAYKDRFQDSTWLTLMENRLSLSRELLSDRGSFYLHLDYNADYMGRFLLNDIFSKKHFVNEIVWYFSDNFQGNIKGFANNHNSIVRYTKTKNYIFNKVMIKLDKPVKRDKRIWSKEKQGLVSARDDEGKLIYQMFYDKKADDVWTIGQSSTTKRTNKEYIDFDTQKPEELMRRVILSSTEDKSIVVDYFSGSGTTINTAHKLNRKWIGIEMGEHFNTVNIPRIKKTMFGLINGISKELEKNKNLKKGGLVKYYELESYEDVLSKAEYQLNSEGVIDLYNSRKLVNDTSLDKSDGIKLNYKNIYNDIDIFETISNISGWKIKQRFNGRCLFIDGKKEIEIREDELYFNEYPFLRDLIWWRG